MLQTRFNVYHLMEEKHACLVRYLHLFNVLNDTGITILVVTHISRWRRLPTLPGVGRD